MSAICVVRYDKAVPADISDEKIEIGFDYDMMTAEEVNAWIKNDSTMEIKKFDTPLKIDAFDLNDKSLCVMMSNATKYILTVINLETGNKKVFEIKRNYRRVESTLKIIDDNIVILECYNQKGFIQIYDVNGKLLSAGRTTDVNFVELYSSRIEAKQDLIKVSGVDYFATNHKITAINNGLKTIMFSNSKYHIAIIAGYICLIISLGITANTILLSTKNHNRKRYDSHEVYGSSNQETK